MDGNQGSRPCSHALGLARVIPCVFHSNFYLFANEWIEHEFFVIDERVDLLAHTWYILWNVYTGIQNRNGNYDMAWNIKWSVPMLCMLAFLSHQLACNPCTLERRLPTIPWLALLWIVLSLPSYTLFLLGRTNVWLQVGHVLCNSSQWVMQSQWCATFSWIFWHKRIVTDPTDHWEPWHEGQHKTTVNAHSSNCQTASWHRRSSIQWGLALYECCWENELPGEVYQTWYCICSPSVCTLCCRTQGVSCSSTQEGWYGPEPKTTQLWLFCWCRFCRELGPSAFRCRPKHRQVQNWVRHHIWSLSCSLGFKAAMGGCIVYYWGWVCYPVREPKGRHQSYAIIEWVQGAIEVGDHQ